MGTEKTGFEPEPTYPLAEQAEIQVLRERLYAAQNALVRLEAEIARLEGERRGKVLVDPEDLRAILLGGDSVTTVNAAAVQAAWNRLAAAAGAAPERAQRDQVATAGAPVADGEQAESPDAPEGAQRVADGAP
jgi:hypothetical protein